MDKGDFPVPLITPSARHTFHPVASHGAACKAFVHHKFVVCGFSGQDPVVYCGSSNLALLGEQKNGDNLIAIHDNDIATVFAIEAIALVDHFDFLDRQSTMAKKAKSAKTASPSKQEQAEAAGWFLSSDGNWADPYYDESDLRCADRKLFA